MAYPKTLREFSREIVPKVRPSNAIGKLRRIRTEVGLLMQQLDDALANIEDQPGEHR